MDIISKYFNKPSFWDKFTEDDLAASAIRSYYRGKTVFVTGATGFLGQLYVEKLLRCDVAHIYILARAKKNKTTEQRIAEIFKGVQFSLLEKYDANFLKRITIVEGDLSQLRLGIKQTDLNVLRENVDIIIHAAADVRFQEKLQTLVLVNLRGTRELLLLAEHFKKLEIFTYISTAYSNCPKGRKIYEQFYDYPVDPDKIIALAERIGNNVLEQDILEVLTDRTIFPWPNTYTFTKSLSEEMVRRFGNKIPIIIIRPSIVISTYQEPIPAWINNIYGINGMLVAVGMGFIRAVPASKNTFGDMVCADFVINATLAAIWDRNAELKELKILGNRQEAKIYTVGSSNDCPLKWHAAAIKLMKPFEQEPSDRLVWATCKNTTTSPFLWTYYNIMFHLIPSIIFDIVLKLTGNTLRVLPYSRKVKIFLNSLMYFMTHEWIFDNANMHCVLDRMSSIDKQIFRCDLREFDYDAWAMTYMMGLKIYLAGDTLDTEKCRAAKTKYQRMKFMHYFVRIAYYAFNASVIYGLAKGFGLVDYVKESARDWQYFLNNPESLRETF